MSEDVQQFYHYRNYKFTIKDSQTLHQVTSGFERLVNTQYFDRYNQYHTSVFCPRFLTHQQLQAILSI